MPARKKKADGPCPECFPDGWDGIDKQHDLVGARVNGVGCEHGTWSRDATVATAPAATEKADDEQGDGE